MSEGMLCLKWKDKREVCMLSTPHDDSVIEKRRRGRETTDGTEVIKNQELLRSTITLWEELTCPIKWYFTMGMLTGQKNGGNEHSLDLCITNANVLYNLTAPKKLNTV